MVVLVVVDLSDPSDVADLGEVAPCVTVPIAENHMSQRSMVDSWIGLL